MLLILSSLCLIAALVTNYRMYIQYSNSSGKTQGLFGLNELLQFGYRKLFAILPTVGLILSLNNIRHKDHRFLSISTALISIMAIVFSIYNVWRLFI